jgi:VCBS repeat-containing protein
MALYHATTLTQTGPTFSIPGLSSFLTEKARFESQATTCISPTLSGLNVAVGTATETQLWAYNPGSEKFQKDGAAIAGAASSVSIADNGGRLAAESGSGVKVYERSAAGADGSWSWTELKNYAGGSGVSLSGDGATVCFYDSAAGQVHAGEVSSANALPSVQLPDVEVLSMDRATGTLFVAGMPSFDDGVRNDMGKVAIYEWDGSSQWAPKGAPIVGAEAGQLLGSDVAIAKSAETGVITVAARDGDGRTRVYRWDGVGQWLESVVEGSFENFTDDSISLGISGDVLAVRQDSGSSGGSSAVEVYARQEGQWRRQVSMATPSGVSGGPIALADAQIYVSDGASSVELHDVYDFAISDSLQVERRKLTSYSFRYLDEDAERISVAATVAPEVAPTISIASDSMDTAEVEAAYLSKGSSAMLGVTATDGFTGEEFEPEIVSSNLDMDTEGGYPISFKAVDPHGNEATATFTFTVIEPVSRNVLANVVVNPTSSFSSSDLIVGYAAGNIGHIALSDSYEGSTVDAEGTVSVDASFQDFSMALAVEDKALNFAEEEVLVLRSIPTTIRMDEDEVFHMLTTDVTQAQITSSANIVVSVSAGHVVSLTPAANWSGSEDVTIAGTTVTVTVGALNDAPVVGEIADVNLSTAVGGTASTAIALSASDADDSSVAWTAEVLDAAIASIELNGSNLTITGQSRGSTLIVVHASDGKVSTPQTINVIVAGENAAPVLGDISDPGATEGGATITITLSATDEEDASSALVFELTGTAISGLTTPANGIWTFDPTHADYNGLKAGQTQEVPVNYKVTDTEGSSDTGSFTIFVTGTNDAPVATYETNVEVGEDDDAVPIDLRVTDPDGDTLTYALVSPETAPTGLAVNGNGEWSFDPSSYDSLKDGATAVFNITYSVSDGTATVEKQFTITVTGTNDGPVAAALTAQTADFGTEETYTHPVFTDPDDNDTLTYTASLGDDSDLPNSIAYDASSRTFTFTNSVPAGSYTLKVTATDSSSASVSAIFSLTVTAQDDVTTLASAIGIEGTAQVGQTLVAKQADESDISNATFSDDDGISSFAIVWQVSEDGSASSFSDTSVTGAAFSVTSAYVSKYVRFKLTATDSNGVATSFFSPASQQITSFLVSDWETIVVGEEQVSEFVDVSVTDISISKTFTVVNRSEEPLSGFEFTSGYSIRGNPTLYIPGDVWVKFESVPADFELLAGGDVRDSGNDKLVKLASGSAMRYKLQGSASEHLILTASAGDDETTIRRIRRI